MKKLIGVLIVLSLVFGLMVAGCKTEPEEEVVVDPSGGKTVDAKYWGTYNDNSGGATVILSEKKLVIDTKGFPPTHGEFQAWTDGENLYIYYTGYTNEISHYGIFTSDTVFEKPNIIPKQIWTKTSNEVSVAPEFRGRYKMLAKYPFNNGTNFYIDLTRFNMKQSFKFDNHPERDQTVFKSFAWTVKNELYTKELKSINPVTGEFKNNILIVNDTDGTSEYIKIA